MPVTYPPLVFTAQFQAGHVIEALHAERRRCADRCMCGMGVGRGPWLHNRRRQSEITALCRLWQCAVAALDKTNDGAERRISARSVTDFHWTGTDPIHSDRSRSRVSTKIGVFSTYFPSPSLSSSLPADTTLAGSLFQICGLKTGKPGSTVDDCRSTIRGFNNPEVQPYP